MGTPWNESEINYLYEAWGNTPVKQIAAHLGRSVNAIYCKVHKFGLGYFLDNGDRKNYINKHQLFIALGLGSAGDSYKNISWMKNRGLPTHRIKRLNATFDVIYVDEFWEWAEKYKTFIDFSNFEKYSLGPEPEWVEEKRKRDFKFRQQYRMTPWTTSEDQRLLFLLRQYKYSYMELSKMLNRTTGAIQRRITDLGYRERPIKANNMIKWTDEEWELLATLIKAGYRYEEMSDVIGKSAKAIRGRVFDMYLTENLDKVRAYIEDGPWGHGKPPRPLRYKRLMTDEEKEIVNANLSELAGMILAVAKVKSGVSEEYKDYFQKDMCVNWDDVLGCTAEESSCDSCTCFERIQPQYCTRCGGTFYERKSNKVCPACRTMSVKQAQRKFAVLHARGKI